MAKLQGRDQNGMHANDWSKLDTSAIQPSKKLGSKATNEELCDAVKEMLAQAVTLLYGDKKQEKYVKVVDMLMMRFRGALAKANEELQESMTSKVDSLLDQLKSSIEKVIEKHEEDRDKSTAKKLQDLYDAVAQNLGESTARSSQITSTSSQSASTVKMHSSAESSSPQLEEGSSTFNLLLSLQKQVSEGFAKIESMISSSRVQKNAENATASMQSPVEKEIVSRQKISEKEVKSQVSALNSKLGQDVRKLEDENDEASAKKRKKNNLKDVMTGKQFNVLTKLLSKQFDEVVDISSAIVKKVNKGFKSINDRIDKLIKDRSKNGFSWIKLMLFMSLFLIPAVWDKVSDFFIDTLVPFVWEKMLDLLDWIDQNVDIKKTIDDFINGIDWMKHITAIKNSVWEAIKEKFKSWIQDPMGKMIDVLKETYKICTDWVKDLWKVVTGSLTGKDVVIQKKKLEDERIKRDDEKLQKIIVTARDKVEKHVEGVGQKAANAAEKSTGSIKESVEKTGQAVKEGQDKVDVQFKDAVKRSDDANKEIKDLSATALSGAQDAVNKSTASVEQKVLAAADKHAGDISKEADKVVKKMSENGGPSKVTQAELDKANREMDQNSNAEIKPPALDTSLDTLQNVEQYTRVNLGKRDKNTGADSYVLEKDLVDSKLASVDASNHSMMIERLRNREVFGTYQDDHTAVTEHQTAAMSNYLAQKASREKDRQIRDKYAEKITGESAQLSDIEREMKLYGSVDQGITAIASHSQKIEEGLNSNSLVLKEISDSVNEYFGTLNDYIEDIKNKPKGDVNAGVLAIAPPAAASANSANMT